jgi:hypothetical protein
MKRRSFFQRLVGGVGAAVGIRAVPEAVKPVVMSKCVFGTKPSNRPYFRDFPLYSYDASKAITSDMLLLVNGKPKVFSMMDGQLKDQS